MSRWGDAQRPASLRGRAATATRCERHRQTRVLPETPELGWYDPWPAAWSRTCTRTPAPFPRGILGPVPDLSQQTSALTEWLSTNGVLLAVVAIVLLLIYRWARPAIHKVLVNVMRAQAVTLGEGADRKRETDRRVATIEDLLSKVLRFGVVAALIVVILGIFDLLVARCRIWAVARRDHARRAEHRARLPDGIPPSWSKASTSRATSSGSAPSRGRSRRSGSAGPSSGTPAASSIRSPTA